MDNKKEFDFGFSLVDEDELRSLEKELSTQVETVTLTAEQYKEKLHTLHGMIMVLMKRLSNDSHKNYIFWPNRQKKIDEFVNMINELVDK